MHPEFIKWLKVINFYHLTKDDNRYYIVVYDYYSYAHYYYPTTCVRWRDIVYYNDPKPSTYKNIKYFIQCILDL